VDDAISVRHVERVGEFAADFQDLFNGKRFRSSASF
jgi:hypothetical protein